MSKVILKLEDVAIFFKGLKAVDGVNIEIKEHELYGLIGPNGAGKTTIFNMITGVYKPTNGKIYLNEKDITGFSERKINMLGIARTFQNIRLFNNMSVIQNVLVGMGNDERYHTTLLESIFRTKSFYQKEKAMRDKAKELLKVFDIYDIRNEKACNLPYGKQRKLEMARALATRPKLLLLDEPAAGMNQQETIELMDTIKFIKDKFDLTVLLIEHDMKLVSGICEKLTVLNFGKVLISGNTKEVLNNKEVIKAYLGDDNNDSTRG